MDAGCRRIRGAVGTYSKISKVGWHSVRQQQNMNEPCGESDLRSLSPHEVAKSLCATWKVCRKEGPRVLSQSAEIFYTRAKTILDVDSRTLVVCLIGSKFARKGASTSAQYPRTGICYRAPIKHSALRGRICFVGPKNATKV